MKKVVRKAVRKRVRKVVWRLRKVLKKRRGNGQ